MPCPSLDRSINAVGEHAVHGVVPKRRESSPYRNDIRDVTTQGLVLQQTQPAGCSHRGDPLQYYPAHLLDLKYYLRLAHSDKLRNVSLHPGLTQSKNKRLQSVV